jgi:CheY-like chemotaxis protein
MAQRVFVKVVGFSAAQRHALNTAFRLSEDRDAAYVLWTPAAQEVPQVLLLDGDSAEARQELQASGAGEAKLVWVGADPPQHSWRVFTRPISWPEVIQALDEHFAPQGAIDFDLGHSEAADTQPPELEPLTRALVASSDREQRLYLRARLALAGLTAVDEADSGAEALRLAAMQSYSIAVVDHSPPGVDGWAVVKALRARPGARPFVIVTKSGGFIADRLRAWLCGADRFLGKPVDPTTLQAVLDKVPRQSAAEPDLVVL